LWRVLAFSDEKMLKKKEPFSSVATRRVLFKI
jgi:hypothetical protein